MSQRLSLEVVAGPLKGQTIGVPANSTLLVGRLPECGLSIPQDLTVSRQHFRIEFRSPECLLVHLSQTGETHVNDVSVSTANLRDQDQILFGTDNLLRVHLEEGPAGTEFTVPAGQVDQKMSPNQVTKTEASCGWNAYSAVDLKLDFATVLQVVSRGHQVYAVIDLNRTGQPVPPDLDDSQFLFHWIAPEMRAQFSPILVPQSTTPDFVKLLQTGWGHDGMVCFGSALSASDVLAHWKKATGVVDDRPGNSMAVFHWPSLLNQILTCQLPKQVAPLLSGLTWILMEAPDTPGNWKLYSNEQLTSVLTSAGLAVVDPSITMH